MVGLINNDDEMTMTYKHDVQHLVKWCANNNLLLNTHKTTELIGDFQHTNRNHANTSIHIYGEVVEILTRFNSWEFTSLMI